MFLERLTGLIDEKGITKNKLLTDLNLARGSFANWEARGNLPNGETLLSIADYFDVSVDYLLGRDIKMSNLQTSASGICFENLSEAQLAMLKCRLQQLIECKFPEHSYASVRFLRDIEEDEKKVNTWFLKLNNYALNKKIPKILNALGRTQENLFNEMNIVISSKSEAKALGLLDMEKYKGVETYPIIVPGNIIFDRLFGLSLASLSVLSQPLSKQITYGTVYEKAPNKTEDAFDMGYTLPKTELVFDAIRSSVKNGENDV